MVACPQCGFSNVDEARFCSGCGSLLEQAPPAREVRKTVTIVFCDVTGSTALGERLDPESLRQVMARYFDAMRAVIERHGGTVEKFIGDAVMAVFGVPTVHEDDALRAVRAASEMRSALADLNAGLDHDFGIRLEARIGVNTGEVVAGTEERLATGDAVNLAARLEQAAAPGEILIGAETLVHVRGAVTTEDLAPLDLKGKTESVPAHRLVSVDAVERPRRRDGPLVGRDRELRLLRDAWDRAATERACVLFSVLGAAGVGKSRLASEFVGGGEITVVSGRCLSYGEGITYWPVTEVVIQLAGLGRAVDGGPLAGLLGGAAAPTSPEEIAFAFRQLVERAAADRPLLIVFDDIHWGEPAFLDLVEHVATMSRDAPILVLCMARPELLDGRPGWGGGLLNATTVLLGPLSGDETAELISALGTHLDDELAGRIRAASEGNPLFVEEMLAMVDESGGTEVAVPPTVQALLAARLDQLDGDERSVLEHGSVEGQVFHRGAVEALGVSPHPLAALVRKELVRPEPSIFAGDDAYRFRHLLIRDAAYDALPKAIRAELHARFAAWLEEHEAELVERDEIIGYHLEQAFRYRRELGPVDDEGLTLAARASGRLAAGGRVARMRADYRAAGGLLTRAVDLLPEGEPSRLELELELVRACCDIGDFGRAEGLIDRIMEASERLGVDQLGVRARLEQLNLRSMTAGPDAGPQLDEFREAAVDLELLGDERGLAHGLFYFSRALFFLGRCELGGETIAKAIEIADRLGLLREQCDWREWQGAAERYGPTPAREALASMEETIAWGAARGVQALGAEVQRAALLAMCGDVDEAREIVRRLAPMAWELGLIEWASLATQGGYLEMISGDAEAAVEWLRPAWDRFGELGETGFRSTTGTHLAEALVAVGRVEEAESILAEVEQFVAPDDFDPQVRLRMVRATILIGRGRADEAEVPAREAVATADATDYVDLRGDAHAVLGDVLAGAGRTEAAAEEWQTAAALYERKGNIVMAARIRERPAR